MPVGEIQKIDFFKVFDTKEKLNAEKLLLSKGYDALSLFTDYLLDVFDAKHFADCGSDALDRLLERAGKDETFYKLTQLWFAATKKGELDFFGQMYEEFFQSKTKASMCGQFFTPHCIAKMCVDLCHPEGGIISDCCCGSGRMILPTKGKCEFAFCGDIDISSVKMCALNLMINEFQGLVVQQDALLLDKPQVGYLINPTDFPIKTGILSIQKLSADECAEIVDWQEGKEVHYNFQRFMHHREYMTGMSADEIKKITNSCE